MRRHEDCENGTYIISWIPPAPGDYEISVDFKGTFGGVAGPVRGSPVIAHFEAGQPAENNTMSGPAMVAVTEADINALLQFATKASPYVLGVYRFHSIQYISLSSIRCRHISGRAWVALLSESDCLGAPLVGDGVRHRAYINPEWKLGTHASSILSTFIPFTFFAHVNFLYPS